MAMPSTVPAITATARDGSNNTSEFSANVTLSGASIDVVKSAGVPLRANSILQAGIREAMCVPLQGRQSLDGVIYIDTTTPAEQLLVRPNSSRFREDHLRLLVAIGRQAALAVENHRYQQAFVKAERLAAMGQTIATLSHHIKNILQGVRGGSYLIDLPSLVDRINKFRDGTKTSVV